LLFFTPAKIQTFGNIELNNKTKKPDASGFLSDMFHIFYKCNKFSFLYESVITNWGVKKEAINKYLYRPIIFHKRIDIQI
jgi:hypothetical protein